jgi:UDP-N-acetylmuramyl tripeptide synthase
VYNALAAAAVAGEAGVRTGGNPPGPRGVQRGFRAGREGAGGERKRSFLLLIKNPVGFNEILRTFVASPADEAEATSARHVLIAINDNHADGRDVSWLWDVDFEMLVNAGAAPAGFHVSGIRAQDMGVRLKYAELPVQRGAGSQGGTTAGTRCYAPGETLYVLPTYTAMLELRQVLSDLGYTHPFWEE